MGTCMKNNATPREVGPLKVIIRHAAHFQWLATHPGHFLCSPNMASQAKYKMSFWLFLGCHPARAPHVHTFQIPSWLDAESFPGPVLPGHSGQGGSSMGSLCKRPGSYQRPLVTGCLISLCHSTLRPREASLLFQLCLYWITQLIASDEAVIFLMFGQAVNIVILAHFNKYRQVWVLVIFLQTRWWLFFPFSFLSEPFYWASKQSVETDVWML